MQVTLKKLKNYGFPYQGSKSKIALDIIEILPQAENFYDLFAGGCAITHCALLSDKWRNVICNDLQGTPQLFKDAIEGKYKNEKRWISREEFNQKKFTDLYIRFIWSFGNNGKSYLFGKDIEEIKRQAHEFLMANGYDGTTETRIKLIKEFNLKEKLKGKRAELQQLEQLERLQQLRQLQQLERLEQLEIYSEDYKKIEIKPNSIVYCDPPYNQKENKKEDYYSVKFNTKEFLEWARTRNFPVYFSSCFCEDAFFKVVFEKKKQCLMNNKGSDKKSKEIIEKVYWNGVSL